MLVLWSLQYIQTCHSLLAWTDFRWELVYACPAWSTDLCKIMFILTDLMGYICVAKFQQANRPLEKNEFSGFYKLCVYFSLVFQKSNTIALLYVYAVLLGKAMLPQHVSFVVAEWRFMLEMLWAKSFTENYRIIFWISVCSYFYSTDYIHRFCWRDGYCLFAGIVYLSRLENNILQH